jgi:hypothetical protein
VSNCFNPENYRDIELSRFEVIHHDDDKQEIYAFSHGNDGLRYLIVLSSQQYEELPVSILCNSSTVLRALVFPAKE